MKLRREPGRPTSGRVKRTRHLFLLLRDQASLDFFDLLRGSTEVKFDPRIVAVSLLNGRTDRLSEAEVRALLAVSSEEWRDIDDLVGTEIKQDAVEQLLRKGLLISGSADLELKEVHDRDMLLSEVGWSPYALLTHLMSRWRGRDIRKDLPRDGRSVADDVSARSDRFEALVRAYGPPPSHFHRVSDPRASVELPLILQDEGLFETLAHRKTTRSFDPKAVLSLEALSTVLYYVWGCHGYLPLYGSVVGLKKTSPSGGDLHAIESYPLVRRVEGIASGLYHYNVEHHRLDLLVSLNEREVQEWMIDFSAGQTYFADAQVSFVLSARFQRSYWKYRVHDRAYAVLLMEAGHLSQTLYLVCADHGLGAYISAAINSADIDDRLGLDGVTEGTIAFCGCGKPSGDNSGLEAQFLPYVPRQTRLPPA
jgi:putative peptide maturation dehydrogenase